MSPPISSSDESYGRRKWGNEQSDFIYFGIGMGVILLIVQAQGSHATMVNPAWLCTHAGFTIVALCLQYICLSNNKDRRTEENKAKICKDFASNRILGNDDVVLEQEDMKRRLIKLEIKMTKLLEMVSHIPQETFSTSVHSETHLLPPGPTQLSKRTTSSDGGRSDSSQATSELAGLVHIAYHGK